MAPLALSAACVTQNPRVEPSEQQPPIVAKQRSFLHNDEVNAIIVSRDFGQRMEQVFENDQHASRAVTLERWEKRSWWRRLKEFTVRLFGYWL